MIQAMHVERILVPAGSLRQIVMRAAAVAAAGAAYCFLHTLLTQTELVPVRSILWAVAAVAPWYLAFELGLRRLGRPIAIAAILLATLLISTVLERLALGRAIADPDALALHLFHRLPALAIVSPALLLCWARIGRRSAEPAPADAASASEAGGPLAKRLGLAAADIHWVRASRNYVEVHAGGRSYVLRATLREVEQALAGHPFVRIHRSTIVNREKIAAVRLARAGWVELADGTRHQVGPAYRAGLHAFPKG